MGRGVGIRQQVIHHCDPDVRLGIARIERDRLLEIFEPALQPVLAQFVFLELAPHEQIVRLGILRAAGALGPDRLGRQRQTHFTRDRRRDLVLQREAVSHRTIKCVRPQHRAPRVDQLHLQPDATALRLQLARQEHADAELPGHVRWSRTCALEAGGAQIAGHLESRRLAQRARQLARHAVGQIFLRRIATEVFDREHGQRARSRRRRNWGDGQSPGPPDPQTRDQDQDSPGGDGEATSTAGRRSERRGRRDSGRPGAERIQRPDQIVGALRTFGRVFLEATHHEIRERRGHVRTQAIERLGRLGRMRRQHRVRRSSGERHLAGEHLVRHRAPRVQVRAMIEHGVAGDLLGGHVRRRAQRDANGGD